MNLEADSKGNEVWSFNFESSRFYVVLGALGPNNACLSLPIASHENIGFIFGYVHFFSVHPFPNMDDDPLIIPRRNSIDGGLDGFEITIAVDIDHYSGVAVDLFGQEGRVDLLILKGGEGAMS